MSGRVLLRTRTKRRSELDDSEMASSMSSASPFSSPLRRPFAESRVYSDRSVPAVMRYATYTCHTKCRERQAVPPVAGPVAGTGLSLGCGMREAVRAYAHTRVRARPHNPMYACTQARAYAHASALIDCRSAAAVRGFFLVYSDVPIFSFSGRCRMAWPTIAQLVGA